MAYVHTELQATFYGMWYRRPCMSVDKNEVLGEIRRKKYLETHSFGFLYIIYNNIIIWEIKQLNVLKTVFKVLTNC